MLDSVMNCLVKFRRDLCQLLFEHGIPSNPCWTEDDIVAGFRRLLDDNRSMNQTIPWKAPVVVRFNGRDMYNGSDTIKAYQITGIITGVLHTLQKDGVVTNGVITVHDANEERVYFEVYGPDRA